MLATDCSFCTLQARSICWGLSSPRQAVANDNIPGLQIAAQLGIHPEPVGSAVSLRLTFQNTLLLDSTRLADVVRHLPECLASLEVREPSHRVSPSPYEET